MKKGRATAPAPAGDDASFRDAVRDVRPIRAANRVEPARARPAPVPVRRIEDERAVLDELMRAATSTPLATAPSLDEEGMYLRAGLPRDILRKLRRTHWIIEEDLDLHGLSGEEAVFATARFLADCRQAGVRCVRIIHGKGLRSQGREPVLKGRIRGLLAGHADVLAYVEPRAPQGGGGAVIVLLEA